MDCRQRNIAQKSGTQAVFNVLGWLPQDEELLRTNAASYASLQRAVWGPATYMAEAFGDRGF